MAHHQSEPLVVKDRRDDFPIFIHSELDDYGLNNVEFRVYSRLARRAGQHGRHKESVPNMARQFKVSIRTIQYALKLLIACEFITPYPRPGRTTEYSINPRAAWKNKCELARFRSLSKPAPAITKGTPTPTGATTNPGAKQDGGVVHLGHGVVVQPKADEGTPFEGTPKEIQQRAKRADLPSVSDVSDSRGTRIPKDFGVTHAVREWARMKAPLVDVDDARDEFFDYWDALPGSKARKLNWDQTFKNRLRELQARTGKAANSYEQRRKHATHPSGIRVSSNGGAATGFKGSITG